MNRLINALDIAFTILWWTLRSRGRALWHLLRGRPSVAAIHGEGLR